MVRTPNNSQKVKVHRLLLLLPAGAALLSGIAGGLVRLGWDLPAPEAGTAWHGALMVAGFFGTLIALERAVALGRAWAYLAPVLSAAGGGILLATGQPSRFLGAVFAAGALGLVASSFGVVRRQMASFTVLPLVGAGCLLGGNVLWTFEPSSITSTLLWAAFLVTTVAGERLELSRALPVPEMSRTAFAWLVASVPAAVLLSVWNRPGSGLALGAILIAIAMWLLRNDVARRTVRTRALPRFTAYCLLTGYVWLAVAGVLLLLGGIEAGPLHDGALHGIFLGFVVAMVFGHAPIILPAVLGARFPYHPVLYLPLASLHLALGLRIGGSLTGELELTRWGGLGNGLSIALFVALALTLTVGASLRRRR